jgi:hypothetical protein
MTRRKLIREIERRARVRIIECRVAGSGHLRLRLACGAVVIASATPSCQFAIQHIAGDCRRANHQGGHRAQ